METALKKAIRTVMMMTMKSAAIEVGVTPQTMANWNTGKTPIGPDAFKKLHGLGIPKDVLINPTKKE